MVQSYVLNKKIKKEAGVGPYFKKVRRSANYFLAVEEFSVTNLECFKWGIGMPNMAWASQTSILLVTLGPMEYRRNKKKAYRAKLRQKVSDS